MANLDAHPRESRVEEGVAQRIVAAARRYFLSHGFRGVTMDDLAAELGMSKKTLYAHFPSKHALLEAVLLHKFQDIDAKLSQITSDCSADFVGALHRLLATVQQHAVEVQPSFVRDIQRETPDLFVLIETRRREIIQRYFGKLLGEGRKAGMIRKDVSVTLILEIFLGAVQSIVNPPKLGELDVTPQTAITAIISVILEGP